MVDALRKLGTLKDDKCTQLPSKKWQVFNMLVFGRICFSVYIETIVIVHVDLLHKGVESQFNAPREQNDLKPQGHVF